MNISFKKSFMVTLTLLVLVFSALGTTPAYATWVFNNKIHADGLGGSGLVTDPITVNGVYVSGSTIYAATTSGLSISTNGGSSFSNTTANLITNLGSNTVYGVFVNGTTIYAATDGGLSISTDGGSTFSNKTTTQGLGSITVRGVFVSGTTIYAATAGGLSISTDGGSTFSNKTAISNGLGNDFVRGVFVSGTTIYAATDGGLSISTDGGSTFSNKTVLSSGLGSNSLYGVFVSGTTIYAATDGGLAISTNGGSNFSNKTTVNTSGLGENAILGVFANGSTIYAATTGGLSISTDGGTSFTNYAQAQGLASDIVKGVFISGTTIYAATGANLGVGGGLSIGNDIDITAPTINSFTAAASVANFNIPITAFTASDDFAVTGYLITETSTPPSAGAGGWSGTAPTNYVVTSNNTYTLYPWAKDAAGHVSAVYGSPASVTVLDNTAPETNIDSQPSNLDVDNTPTFTFSGNDGAGSGVASFKCQMDGGSYAICISPFTSSALSDGSHTFSVKAIDNATNEDATPASYTWTVDTTSPNTTINSQPSSLNNDSTPDFTFSGNDGAGSGVASFKCQMDAGAYAACTSPFTSSALTDGSHTFNVKAIDNAANEDATPASYTWTLDATAPDTSIDDKPSNPNNDSTPDFAFSGTDVSGSGVASFKCQMDAGSYATCTSPFTSSTLTDGSHTFNVKAIDNAGNEDAAPATYTWTVDALAPSVSSIVRVSAATTNALSVDFAVVFSKPVTGVDTADFSLTTPGTPGVSGAAVSLVTGSDATYTVTVTTGSGNGTIRLDVPNTATIIGVNGHAIAALPYLIGESYTINKGLLTPPSVPALASPTDNQLLTAYTPFLDWGSSSTNGSTFDHYQIQVATDAAFSGLVTDVNITGISNSFYNILSVLAHNTKFYWRVRAVNLAGGTSNWSAVRSFRIIVDAATLVSPINDAIDVLSLRPSLDWDDVAGPGTVTGYTIQISKNDAFTQIVHTGNSVLSNYVPTADLPKGILLHWRVQTKGANGPSAWSAAGSFNSANSPTTPVLSLPAANALNTNYTPIFKWSAVTFPAPTAFKHYQLQVDNNADFSTPELDVTSPTNQFDAPALDHNTKFYWRVRAVNLDNEESNWSAVRYFRTIVDAAINLSLSPINGIEALSLRPTFDWGDVARPGAITGYTIQISKNNAFTQIVHTGNSVLSSYVPTADLPKGILLHWRVQTKGANGPSAWSAAGSFNSANSPTTPVLSLPALNALNTDYTPIFKWSAVTLPTLPAPTIFKYYQLQVDDNSDFSSPVIDDTSITDRLTVQFQVPLLAHLAHNTKFYWRVRAVNTDNEEGTWSAVRYFRTIVDAATLISPSNGSDPVSLRPIFDWGDASGPGAVTYTVQIWNATLTKIVHTGNSVTSSYIPTADLPKDQPLLWRVQTKGANGPSAWSEVWSFVSANSPTTPALSLPATNALNTNYTPLFKWSAVTVPALTTLKHYQLQVSDNANFSNLVIDNTSITDRLITQFKVPDLTPLAQNTKFYWRVRAINDQDEEGNWSAVGYFRTIVDAPTLLSPANASPADSLKPVFDWANATGPGAITNYTIQVSASPTFATLLINATTVASTYTPLANLPTGKTLHWRVRVNGANGPSAWTMFSFTTP